MKNNRYLKKQCKSLSYSNSKNKTEINDANIENTVEE